MVPKNKGFSFKRKTITVIFEILRNKNKND
jgi:hypothetical protein